MAGKKVVLLPETKQVLERLGTNIKRARLRRNISAEILARNARISTDTLSAIEKGVSTVSIGAYAAVLASLDMEKDLEQIASDEDQKQRYLDLNLRIRKRATKRPQEERREVCKTKVYIIDADCK